MRFLKLRSVFALALLAALFPTMATAEAWTLLYCHNPANSESIEVEVSAAGKASVKTNESLYFVYGLSCSGVSSRGPFLKCSESLGTDFRSLYSFSRVENGFINGYSDELVNTSVLHIVFERSYVDSRGSHQETKREFKFKLSECTWE